LFASRKLQKLACRASCLQKGAQIGWNAARGKCTLLRINMCIKVNRGRDK
jgi:hypothetical protein